MKVMQSAFHQQLIKQTDKHKLRLETVSIAEPLQNRQHAQNA